MLIDQHGIPLRAASGRGGASSAYQAADRAAADLLDWLPRLASADGDILAERGAVVARFRDLARNDAWLSGLLSRESDAVVGAGLRFQSTPDWRALGVSREAAEELATAVETEWRRFSGDALRRADLSQRMTLEEMDGLLYRHMQTDGEAVLVAHWRPENGGRYATCFQVVDPDRLSNPWNGPDTRHQRAGIELNEDGVRVAAHFQVTHPADGWLGAEPYRWERVCFTTDWGRPQVVHAFEATRADQTRGLPSASVIRACRMLQTYASMEMQAAIINALFAAFVESPFDNDLVGQRLGMDTLSRYQDMRSTFHQERGYTIGGARIPHLFPGERFNFSAAARPAGGFGPFMNTFLRYMAAGTGQTYMQVSQDWSGTNYSSGRMALLDVVRSVTGKRSRFCGTIKAAQVLCFLEEAFDRGYLKAPAGAPDFHDAPEAYARCRWIGPGAGVIDPVKEAQAAQMRLDNLTSTLETECLAQGMDWEEVIEQRAREQDRMSELGVTGAKWSVVADTDPDTGAAVRYERAS
jgi:lambda family phage portal protein